MSFLGGPQPDLLLAASAQGTTDAPAGRQETPIMPPRPEQVVVAPARWSDDLALSILVNDFEYAQRHRQQNFELLWDDADRLLHGNVVQKVWPGTNTPRSSLGIKLTWQQIESLLPRVMAAIFDSSDGIFFDCFPRPGTSPTQALAAREFISSQFDEVNLWETVRRVLKSAFLYGTGIVKIAWLRQDQDREFWSDELVPIHRVIQGVKIAVGQKREFKRRRLREHINRPDIFPVSLRDFYIDPGHKQPQVDGAKFAMQRAFYALDDLLLLSDNDPSYKIPSKAELIDMARKKQGPAQATADMSKQRAAQEAQIREKYPSPAVADPAKFPFEIIEYQTEDRLVTALNRRILIRNIANPDMALMYKSVNYTDVLNQFYGKGIAEIIEGEQRLQQGLVNSHLDETSLIIHGTKIIQSGAVLNKQQLLTRPGGYIEATSVEAVKQMERQPVTQDAFIALQQSQMRAQQYTGVSDIIVQGAPSIPTSATRTATGVNKIAGAAFSRVEYMVEVVERNLIVPIIERVLELNQRYLDPRQVLRVLGKTLAGEIHINPLDIINGQFSFELRAASRMTARDNMRQSLPFVLQIMLNPGLIEKLGEVGVKPDIQAIMRDTLETLGWRNRSDWFVPLSQQDQQALQQPQNIALVKEQMKGQREQARTEAKAELEQQKMAADAALLVLDKALDSKPAAAAALGYALDASRAHEVEGIR